MFRWQNWLYQNLPKSFFEAAKQSRVSEAFAEMTSKHGSTLIIFRMLRAIIITADAKLIRQISECKVRITNNCLLLIVVFMSTTKHIISFFMKTSVICNEQSLI
jgi:hypothetical protein